MLWRIPMLPGLAAMSIVILLLTPAVSAQPSTADQLRDQQREQLAVELNARIAELDTDYAERLSELKAEAGEQKRTLSTNSRGVSTSTGQRRAVWDIRIDDARLYGFLETRRLIESRRQIIGLDVKVALYNDGFEPREAPVLLRTMALTTTAGGNSSVGAGSAG